MRHAAAEHRRADRRGSSCAKSLAQSCRWLITWSAEHKASDRRPEALVLFVHVEDEAPDWRRREPAIVHEFAPVGITGLAHVLAEGVEQFESVSRVEPSQAELTAQRLGLRVGRPASAERVIEPIEARKLLVGRQIRMIGDVVSRPGETIVGEDRRAAAARSAARRRPESSRRGWSCRKEFVAVVMLAPPPARAPGSGLSSIRPCHASILARIRA